ncbi:helix-turn-helix transcriptional regulator [Actinoallomurus sp. NPDC052308]|uniref:helix-turn-helix domain-containing protein n=1 Tax=Actinoallomurus sp. NPDC052308 TaxID=3155530 RepID=UPI00343A6B57
MVSPYVRAHRLRAELVALRAEAGLTHAALGKLVGRDRQPISRLENGRSLDIDLVLAILEALKVEGERYSQIVKAAHDAGSRGWWDSAARAMGERQALAADLEAGAISICEYQQTIIPGLLQMPEYTRTRIEADPTPLQPGVTKEGILRGRAGRQRRLRQPDGPTYEVILNEFAVRRRSAPAAVLREQLLHIAKRADEERITIRVLPIAAELVDYNIPATSFTAFSYPEVGDPTVIGIETVTSYVALTDPDQVAPHLRLYDSLREAALPIEASREFIIQVAESICAG